MKKYFFCFITICLIYLVRLFLKWRGIQNSNPDKRCYFSSPSDMKKNIKEYPRISFKTFLKFYRVAPEQYYLYKDYIKRKDPHQTEYYKPYQYVPKEPDIGINLGFFDWLIYRVFYKLNDRQKEKMEKNEELKKLLNWVNQDIETEMKKEQVNIAKCSDEIKRIVNNM